MAKAKTLVGLDVHATKIVAAVLDAETGQLQTFGMSGDSDGAAGFCAGLPRPVRVAYEAGPTGYGLARELAKRGIECIVAAPSKIPRASGTGSRPIVGTPSISCGCCWPASFIRSGFPAMRKRRCATWCVLARRSGLI